MKLIALLMIIGLTQVSAAVFSQQITLKEKNAPLDKVLKEIRTQSGYQLFYDESALQQAGTVTLDVKNVSVEEALTAALKGQALEFTVIEKTIVVKVKETGLLDKLKAAVGLNQVDVTGKVVDENNQPLASATVIVKGTGNSTITDAKGVFVLKKVDPNAVIIISFVGYDKKEVPVAVDLGTIRLAVASDKLDEVQVIAYGQTTERLNVGNIASVSAKEIEEQPVSNPLLALEGRVPGLFITQASGLPGSPVNVRIQGQNSIGAGNDPFYVIDGVPYASELLSTTGNILGPLTGNISSPGAGGSNPFSFINPDDIENIEILKDADATAIYGSRAANGAILITTKKGKAGDTKVNFNLQQGYGQVSNFIDLLNTQQYLEMRHEAFKNDGTMPGQYDYDVNGLWDTTRNTNWQKVLLGGTAKYEDYNASVSGGTINTQFLISGTLHRETTVFPGQFDDVKGSMHFNLDNTSNNKKFRLNLSGSYLVDNDQLPGNDLTGTALTLAPDAPSLRNADGSLNWQPDAAGNDSWTNPIAYEFNTYQLKTNNLISSLLLSYELLPGLDIKSSFGYNHMQNNEFSANPLSAIPPFQRYLFPNYADYSYSVGNTWNIEPQLTYKKTVGKGTIDALLGSTLTDQTGDGYGLVGIGYNTDASLPDIHSASRVIVVNSTASVYKYEAIFARLNYNWDSKYIIDLTVRRDGSSRFGPDNEFHNFWSAGGAWIFTDEKAVKDNLAFLSFGKLRGSYGTTGNDQIGDYSYLNLYSSVIPGVPYQGAGALAPVALNNPYLQWEQTRKLQFGLDLGFFKDRVLLTTNFVRNRSSNELLSSPLPAITGFSIIGENLPATVQNKAWEFTLNTINIKNSDFRWNATVNLTIPQNKLLSFPDLAASNYFGILIVGQPIGIIKAYHYLGVNPTTGLYQFESSSGQPTISPNGATDRSVIINTSPKFYGGFQNDFTYKQFRLDIFFSFVKQTGYNNINYGNGSTPGSFNLNEPVYVLNRWQSQGDVKPVQQFTEGYTNFSAVNAFNTLMASDAVYKDASYVRLKNLSFSYQLPDNWSKKVLLQNCNLYIQGQNLLTITKYKGFDPENQNTLSLPPLRVLTLGIKAGL